MLAQRVAADFEVAESQPAAYVTARDLPWVRDGITGREPGPPAMAGWTYAARKWRQQNVGLLVIDDADLAAGQVTSGLREALNDTPVRAVLLWPSARSTSQLLLAKWHSRP